MPALVIEIASLEIPSFMQHKAAEQLLMAFLQYFSVNYPVYQSVFSQASNDTYSTPRRISFVIRGIEAPPVIDEGKMAELLLIKGPKVGAPQQAIDGFMSKHSISDPGQLIEHDGVYFYQQQVFVPPFLTALGIAASHAISLVKWPKSMRWERNGTRWIRPISSILAMFGNEVIDVSYGHISAGKITAGHKFMRPESIEIEDAASYHELLTSSQVMLNREERCSLILYKAQKFALSVGGKLIEDARLIEEVADMVEWPVVLLGEIPAQFMMMPREVLISSIRLHQKYLMIENIHGEIMPYFIFVADKELADGGKLCTSGNQKVLTARLNDARFFYDQDIYLGIEHYRQQLGQIIFHGKIGDMAQKTERIKNICIKLFAQEFSLSENFVKEIANRVKGNSSNGKIYNNDGEFTLFLDELLTAAELCKADLASSMVKEFPELQGIMGGYYAKSAGHSPKICYAISNHYRPQGPSDIVVQDQLGAILAVADKIDSITEMFRAGIKPTGSKDPYALRRAAIGIIRLIEANSLSIDVAKIDWLDEEVRSFIMKRQINFNTE